MSEHKQSTDAVAILRQLFGDNRAEWPSEHFRDLFVSPTYLRKLESMRPCILVGGRGTGKTTSLQSLKYNSTLERLEAEGLGFGDQEYLGVLVRMNKNRVHAFQGGDISNGLWEKAFAHYFNLLVCLELTNMGIWLEKKTGTYVENNLLIRISSDLGLPATKTLKELYELIRNAISALQIYVNNPSNSPDIIFSIAEAPLRTFAEILSESSLLGDRVIFCCIDEYENLLDYQQAILNTYMKHAEPPLSYKVGVRKNGLRNRQTLDGQDLLKTPDDYAEIEIAEEGFEFFANAVAELRLKCAVDNGIGVPYKLGGFLEDLSFDKEAYLLGAHKVSDGVLKELEQLDLDLFKYFSKKSKSEVYFLRYWQGRDNSDLTHLARDWKENETAWSTRFSNHGYASLFWLSKGNKGVRIRKYYCGSKVFLSLPGGNIRYFLELIDSSIGHELKGRDDKFPEQLVISPKSQTLAVRDVGRRKLNQLEGLADHGVQLKRLVLAIGKVFFEFARNPIGKTPEVTSFVVSGDSANIEEISALLKEGVAHLAFEASPRTKATSSAEMRDDEYRLHRIFCGFFEISHRKKRRVTFDAKHLLNVLDESPSKAITALLEGRSQSEEEHLPEQLAFFSAFYDSKQ